MLEDTSVYRCRTYDQAATERMRARDILRRPSFDDAQDLVSKAAVLCSLHFEKPSRCQCRQQLLGGAANFRSCNALAEEPHVDFHSVRSDQHTLPLWCDGLFLTLAVSCS
jgi:hypothetical protein